MGCKKLFSPHGVRKTTKHMVYGTHFDVSANCSHTGMKYGVWGLGLVVLLLALPCVNGDVQAQGYEQEARFKRHLPHTRHQGGAAWRNDIERRIERLEAKPVVHLTGNSSMSTSSQSLRNVPACREVGCFRWNLPDPVFDRSFGYVLDTANNKVVGINITSPGDYFVYSQVGVNGPEQGYDPSVGYETVRASSDGTTTILLRSFATQYKKGRRLMDGQGESPLDSLSHSGVFKLCCSDIITVRQATPEFYASPNFVFDKDQSFFGMIQINRGINGDYDCTSC